MASKDKVTIDNFKRGAVSAQRPKAHSYTDPSGKTGNFSRTPFLFNHGTQERPMVGSLDVEYPPVWMSVSLETKEYKDKETGKMTPVIKGRGLITFSRKDERNQKLVKCLDFLHLDMGNALVDNLRDYGIEGKQADKWKRSLAEQSNEDLGEQLKRLVYYPPEEGKNQTQFVDFMGNDKNGCKFLNLALSINEKGELLSEDQWVYYNWNQLDGRKVLCVPLVQYHRAYKGSAKKEVYPQHQMINCLVIKVANNVNMAKQADSVATYAAEYADMIKEQRNMSFGDAVDQLDVSSDSTHEHYQDESDSGAAASSSESSKDVEPPTAPLDAMDNMAAGQSFSAPAVEQSTEHATSPAMTHHSPPSVDQTYSQPPTPQQHHLPPTPSLPQQAPGIPQQAPGIPQQAPSIPQQAPSIPQQAPGIPQQFNQQQFQQPFQPVPGQYPN